MDIDEIIREAVLQVLTMIEIRILLFISGGAVNIKDIFASLGRIKGVTYNAILSDAAQKVIPSQYITGLNANLIDSKEKMTPAVKEADLIVIPVMTRNTLAKSATGISDNLLTLGISEALMLNKHIIAVKDSFDPENLVNISLGYTKNPAYNSLILRHLRTLEDMGMKFIPASQLKVTLENEMKLQFIDSMNSKKSTAMKPLSGVVTKADLLAYPVNSEIQVREGTLITPLAYEYIESSKIAVKYC